jgi:hypothetical protein
VTAPGEPLRVVRLDLQPRPRHAVVRARRSSTAPTGGPPRVVGALPSPPGVRAARTRFETRLGDVTAPAWLAAGRRGDL